MRAYPLPKELTQFLDANADLVRRVFVERADTADNEAVDRFRDEFARIVTAAGGTWARDIQL